MHRFTEEQINYIAANIGGDMDWLSNDELTRFFNRRFGTQLSTSQIKSVINNRKLKGGRNGRFKPGHVPHNKGKPKYWQGGEATQFKAGHMPQNYRPIGSERVTADGYLEIKVSDPKTWRGKHIVLWEDAFGPVPDGHVVLFADGDKANVSLENLLLISRRELAVLNAHGLVSADANLTKAGIAVADIRLKMAERKRMAKKAM